MPLVKAEKKLKQAPALDTLPSGHLQQNPWLTIANKQLELMQRLMSELGLSPVACPRMEMDPPYLKKPARLMPEQVRRLLRK